MDKKFKWHMLITSFLPLWISIIIIDTIKVLEFGLSTWNEQLTFFYNVWDIIKSNIIICVFMLIIIINMSISLIKITNFLSLQNKNSEELPKAKIQQIKDNANLSLEFLVAYILPMLVFDFVSLLHIVLFILYFSVFAFLSIRNNYVYINIFLELKKYKIFNANLVLSILGNDKTIQNCIIISKSDLMAKDYDDIKYYDLENSVFLGVIKED